MFNVLLCENEALFDEDLLRSLIRPDVLSLTERRRRSSTEPGVWIPGSDRVCNAASVPTRNERPRNEPSNAVGAESILVNTVRRRALDSWRRQ